MISDRFIDMSYGLRVIHAHNGLEALQALKHMAHNLTAPWISNVSGIWERTIS